MNKKIRDHDLFGHPVVLNFKQQGDTSNTVLGGAVSILIKIFLVTFLYFKLTQVVGRTSN